MTEDGGIRPARPGEAALLTALALRSKASWGYSPAFMERCTPLLTVTEAYVRGHPVFVLAGRCGIEGFYSLREHTTARVELDLLFVEPRSHRRGVGRRLFLHAVQRASQLGYRTLVIESDPGAEPFYLRMGAHRAGEVASTVEKGRVLPVLEMTLVSGSTACPT